VTTREKTLAREVHRDRLSLKSYWRVKSFFPKVLMNQKPLSGFFQQLQCLVCSVALLEVWSKGKTWLKEPTGHC